MGKYVRGAQCPYQPGDGVCCPDQTQCETCGWNPEVAARRREEFQRSRPGALPATYADQEEASGLVDED